MARVGPTLILETTHTIAGTYLRLLARFAAEIFVTLAEHAHSHSLRPA